jgi:hypothetical protein
MTNMVKNLIAPQKFLAYFNTLIKAGDWFMDRKPAPHSTQAQRTRVVVGYKGHNVT